MNLIKYFISVYQGKVSKMSDSKFKKDVAGRLKEIRQDLKMTQEQFAELLDISIQLYKKLESGENNISNATLRKMKGKLDFSIDYLFFGEKDNFEGVWNKVITLDDHDKGKLLLRLFILMSSDDRRVALKNSDDRFFSMLDSVVENMNEKIRNDSKKKDSNSYTKDEE